MGGKRIDMTEVYRRAKAEHRQAKLKLIRRLCLFEKQEEKLMEDYYRSCEPDYEGNPAVNSDDMDDY